MIDSHCHLHCIKNLDLRSAEDAGITSILNIFEYVDREFIYNEFKTKINIYRGVGVHPCEVSSLSLEECDFWLRSHVDKMDVIGETGVDLYKSQDLVNQLSYYDIHVQVAKEFQKPIVIHSRACDIEDIISLTDVTHMWHSFSFGPPEARRILDLDNSFISFSGMVTFKSAGQILEALKYCPIDRILIETDCPFLTPEPLRGRPNQPHYISHTYKFIASIKNISVETLTQQLAINFSKFLGK